MSSLVALMPRINIELWAALASGMVCLMALLGGMRGLVGGPDAIAERLERIRRDGLDGARGASRLDTSTTPAAPFIVAFLRPLARLARPSRATSCRASVSCWFAPAIAVRAQWRSSSASRCCWPRF